MNDDDAKIKGREAVIIISFFVSVFVFAVLKVSADWKAALAQERIGKTLDFLVDAGCGNWNASKAARAVDLK